MWAPSDPHLPGLTRIIASEPDDPRISARKPSFHHSRHNSPISSENPVRASRNLTYERVPRHWVSQYRVPHYLIGPPPSESQWKSPLSVFSLNPSSVAHISASLTPGAGASGPADTRFSYWATKQIALGTLPLKFFKKRYTILPWEPWSFPIVTHGKPKDFLELNGQLKQSVVGMGGHPLPSGAPWQPLALLKVGTDI